MVEQRITSKSPLLKVIPYAMYPRTMSSISSSGFDASGETSGDDSYSSDSDDPGTDRITPSISIWIIEKPFEFGTLPIYPSAKISIPMLVKIISYCRQKRWLDTLTLGSWYHICKRKLCLSYHIGWIYIRLYNVLYQQMDRIEGHMGENGEWDDRCNILKSKKYDRQNEFTVPTMKFMLFLLLQHSYRLMTKHGPPTPREEEEALPELEVLLAQRDAESSDDEFDMASVEREEKKIIDEQLQLKFVSKYLTFMIAFLETDDPDRDRDSSRLKLETVDTFDLILRAAKDDSLRRNEPYCLKDIIIRWRLAGYDKLSHTVDRQIFIRWVRQCLRGNPWGFSNGYLKGSIPGIITGVVDEVGGIHVRRENRVMRNYNDAPTCWYTISHVNEQVLFLDDIRIQANIFLTKCHGSYIYLCGSFSCVAIEWCRNCTIYLGCISGVLRITGCKGIQLIGLARQIIINETVLSTFHVHTPCSPILAGNNCSQLYFGPYTTFYQRLIMDMRLAKMGPILSQWDKVQGISYDGLHTNAEFQWTRIEGKLLRQYFFPFQIHGSTHSSPIILQARHSWVLEKKQRCLEKWTNPMSLKHRFKLNRQQRALFTYILFRRFIRYLLRRNLHLEVMGLVSYNEARLEGQYVPPAKCFEGEPTSLDDVLEILLDHVEDVREKIMLKNKRLTDESEV